MAEAELTLEITFHPCLRCTLEGFEAFVLGIRDGQPLVQVDYDEAFVVPIERFELCDQQWIRERMAASGAQH